MNYDGRASKLTDQQNDGRKSSDDYFCPEVSDDARCRHRYQTGNHEAMVEEVLANLRGP